MAAIYVWDDLLFAAPVVGLAKLIGPWNAFWLTLPIYWMVSVLVTYWVVRAYEGSQDGKTSKMANWLSRESQKTHGRIARKLLGLGKVAGFILSSWLAGAVLTTFFIYYGGHRRNILRVAIVSSGIYAVGFVGQYAGISALIF